MSAPSGLNPSSAARFSVMTSSATAPSVICEELPAVTRAVFFEDRAGVRRAPPAIGRCAGRCRGAIGFAAEIDGADFLRQPGLGGERALVRLQGEGVLLPRA